MSRIAWASDLHLDFAAPSSLEYFFNEVKKADADMLIICGDIASGRSLKNWLSRMELELNIPIRFCLGNHDFYGTSIWGARDIAKEASKDTVVIGDKKLLSYLEDVIEDISTDAVLIGHDGWCDGKAGNPNGNIIVNDFFQIADYKPLSQEDLAMFSNHRGIPKSVMDKMLVLATAEAEYFDRFLLKALERKQKVILATHIPPFVEATWYNGKNSEPDFLPFFCSPTVGEVLVKHMTANPDKELLVLCGHTHGEGEVQILPNLKVLTAKATYGRPHLQGVIDV